MIVTPCRSRRGLFLVDAVFGLVLIAATGLLIGAMLANLARLRHATDVRQAALHATANVLEHLAAEPWTRLEPGRRDLELPPEIATVLPGATIEARITDSDDASIHGLRKIEVELRWPESATTPRPIRLTTWLGQTGRPTP
jgi:hypothetical protein